MGQQDLTTKEFLEYPDIFADIGNALLHEGREVMRQEDLIPAPTETFYEGKEGELHDLFQDKSMYERRAGEIRGQYIYENQLRRDRWMNLRKAGYCGGVYRRQLKAKEKFPCVCIVLYWGKGLWNQPRSMEELFGDGEWYRQNREYVDNLYLPVFEMRNLSREVRERFQSDMRFVVDYLAEDEENIPRHQKVCHVKELLRLLKAITGDDRYIEIIDSLLKRQQERGK